MKNTRQLLLLRHAQAEGQSSCKKDFDRVLNEFGRSQPGPVAQELLSAGFSPQLVLCSASARTRETLELLRSEGTWADAAVDYSEAIYECTTRQILMHLSAVDDSVERILLVGHNPGLSDLATGLSKKTVGLRPGEYVWLEFEGDWVSVDADTVRLKQL